MESVSIGWFSIYIAAFFLGVAHSLEPGHGKTVVAAYLVGSRGRSIDALVLGLTVTFTHCFSIILLGLLAKFTAQYFSEQQVHGYLGIVASLLILGMGVWMLKSRWGAIHGHSHGHSHDHSHGHGHDHGHTHDHGHAHGFLRKLFHGHSHGSDGDHSHGHSHAHAPAAEGTSPIGLLLLGISGGIVPCPAALAILLAAVSAGTLGKGLALVLVFSVGLACSLVAIGLVMVHSVKAAARFVDTERYAQKVSLASAVVVTVVGAVTFYSSLSHLAQQ